ncbi:SDR family NAD(P)-dependent oxidoreductase [Streptomyces phytohabitans]|uniref:SDR family NAD(P)-dependent oxidoreductase n=1 Tax=Streptomyces phytohabitans TaxID=1150371 RepID=UPI00345B4F0B
MERRAVVTAGTGGIGLETAVGLAARGLAVTVVGRDAARGARAVERIAATATGGAPRFVAADLSSLARVRSLAAELAADGPPHVLVNNVGAMFPERRRTAEGIEATFAVNHLSPYLLTELLLDPLRSGAPSRVVHVSSRAVVAARRTFRDVEPPGGYYAFHWYGRAKLAHLAYTLDLAERLRDSGVTVLAADPGGAATDMTNGTMRSPRIVSPPLRLLWPLVRRTFARSTAGPAAEAARPSVAAATDPAYAGRGGLLIGPGLTPVRPHRGATDPRTVADVLRLSRELAPLEAPPLEAPPLTPGPLAPGPRDAAD